MRAAVLAALALAACQTPDAKIVYVLTDGASQSCGSTNCADVIIPCEAVISIRILRPDDPAAPLVTICEPLPQNRNKDLCAISSVDLGEAPLELPKETLEVQIVIWPRDQVADPITGELDCGKHEVDFDAVGGFPISQQPSPAIGGHAFYHPGDEETRVVLGCTDLVALNTCEAQATLSAVVSVESFENLGVSVSANQASRFKVDVGEPTFDVGNDVHKLDPLDTRSLALSLISQVVPIWKGDIDLTFTATACAQVLEDAAQATAAISCTNQNIAGPDLELGGIQLPKETLDQLLAALGLASFPPNGMTVGIVIDELFNPVANEVVTASAGTVRYLSADRASIGGTQTTASGIFVSLDAPYTTTFSVPGSAEKIGGQIQGKVTVVILQQQ